MSLAANPYLHRTAIKDDRDFFGRRDELTIIFNRIDAEEPQSVSVVGDRRVGKSSLLRAVLRQRAARLRRPDEFVFVLLDLQGMVHADVPQFFSAFLEEVALATQDHAVADRPPTYETVRKLVAGFDRKRFTLVVLLDEFEAVTQNRNFTLEFLSFLRSLPNNYRVSFIVTSARELQELCHSKEIAGSPFFNIFHRLNLGGFQREEAQELVEKPSQAVGFPLTPFTPFIFRLAGYFPFFLQQACSAFFEFRRQHPEEKIPDLTAIWQMFYEEARDQFEYLWNHLNEREQGLCHKLTTQAPLNEAERRLLGTLGRRGYVQQNASEASLFSDVFAAFVGTKAAATVSAASTTATAREVESAERLLEEGRRIDELLRQNFLRQLAIVFVDLVGSTQFADAHGPFAAFNLVKRLEELVSPIVEQHYGQVVKLVGDAVLARFERAEDAVAAGSSIQQELARTNASLSERDRLRAKVAINYGEALVVEGDVYGDAVNTAERVLRETAADQVVISEFVLAQLGTARAASFGEKGAFSLKGKAQPVRLFSCESHYN